MKTEKIARKGRWGRVLGMMLLAAMLMPQLAEAKGKNLRVDKEAVIAAVENIPCNLQGDFVKNGKVDAVDLNFLLARWGTAAPECDLDGNGVIDGGDLGVFLLNYPVSCSNVVAE